MREMTYKQVLAEYPTASVVNREIIVFDGTHKIVGRLVEEAPEAVGEAPKRGRKKASSDAE